MYWELDDEGVLTISVTGEMPDYRWGGLEQRPWHGDIFRIMSLRIQPGVTSIGYNAFAYNNLTSVNIPDNVTSIGYYAFQNNLLTSAVIGDSVTSIKSGLMFMIFSARISREDSQKGSKIWGCRKASNYL